MTRRALKAALHWRLEFAVVGDDALVSEDDAVVDRRVAADVAVAAENRAADDGVLADAAVGPDDRVLELRLFLDVALPADDAVGADARAGFNCRPGVDEAWARDRRPPPH